MPGKRQHVEPRVDKEWTIQAILDQGQQALGVEMERIRQAAAKAALNGFESRKLCSYIKAGCILSAELREVDPDGAGDKAEDLMVQMLTSDPGLAERVLTKLGERGGAS
jgi:hypothetical protein